MNRLLLLAIILLIIAGTLLLWLSNRWIEPRLERSGRAATTFLMKPGTVPREADSTEIIGLALPLIAVAPWQPEGHAATRKPGR